MTRTVIAVALVALVGCKERKANAKKIALLLPEAKTARYETQDRPLFEAKVKALCADCEVLASNAGQDAARQQSQAEAALTAGAKVIVLDAVDGTAAKAIAEKAKADGAAVIAYDRMIMNTDAVDLFVTFEGEAIGRMQAEALLKALGDKPSPGVVLIHGAPTDPNAALLKKGVMAVLGGKVKVLKEYDTPDWSPDKAQEEMTQALTALAGQPIDGIYAANDGTAGGVIAALKAAGAPIPPVTGQDAEVAAIQRVVAGDQHLTIYKAIRLQAEQAAELAVKMASGGALPALEAKMPNGKKDVPSILLAPTVVTKANVKDTVVKDGFWTRDQICTAPYAEACKAAGL